MLPDNVWLTADAKLRGICEDVRQWRAKRDLVLVVAHFDSTLAEVGDALRAYLDDDPIVTGNVLSRRLRDGGREAGRVFALLAEELRRTVVRDTAGAERGTAVIVAERFPLREADDAVCELGESLPLPCDVVFHLSLDDPLLSVFGDSERTKKLLVSVGMPASGSEPISSPLLTRQVKRVQQTIDRRKLMNSRARSAEE